MSSIRILLCASTFFLVQLSLRRGWQCYGLSQPDHNFVKAKKGKISSSDGTVSAVIDDMPVQFEGSTCSSTVRTTKCEILCTTVKCSNTGHH